MADAAKLVQGSSGQPGQPGSTPTYEELVDRVTAVERQLREGTIDLDRLPLNDLLRKLEAVWQPEPSDLIMPGGVVGSRIATDAITSRTMGPQLSARVNFNANYNIANTANPHNVWGNTGQIDVHPDDTQSLINGSVLLTPSMGRAGALSTGFECTMAGLYLIYQHQLILANLANGLVDIYTLLNGVELARSSVSWQGGQNQSCLSYTIWPLVKGDTITFQTSNFTGANPQAFWAGNYWGLHRLSNF